MDFYNFVQPDLFCGQIAHIPSLSRGIEQKIILARHIAEATCRLRMLLKHCAKLPYLWTT